MFRPSRERRGGEDAFVVWRVRLFALGAVLALAGMGLALRWLVWAGIGALAAGLALRFLPGRG